MSEALQLLSELRDRGIYIWAEGDDLRYRTNSGPLSPKEISQLRVNKKHIIAFLTPIGGGKKAGRPQISRTDRDRPLLLSFAQQRLWFLLQMEGMSEAYHIPLGLRLRGEVNEAALRWALDRLVARHETLRTRFEIVQGEGFQRIDSSEVGFSLRCHDLSDEPTAERDLSALVIDEVQASFDLQRGPLARGRLIRMAADNYVLLVTLHHINADG